MFTDDTIFSDHPSLVENWRGLGMLRHKRKKNTSEPRKKVFLLSNGGRFKTDKEIISATNTCALDSVCQALAIAYTDGSSINPIIQGSDHMLCQLIRTMRDKNSGEEAYKIRSSIAKTYFKNVQVGDVTEVDCECNVLYIYDKILIDCCLYSADEKMSCTNFDCPINTVTRKVSVLRLHDKRVADIQEAASSLIDNMDMTRCRRLSCDGIMSFDLKLKNLISFEVLDELMFVHEAPPKLVLQNHEYELLSVIEFVPPAIGTIGHYKAHY